MKRREFITLLGSATAAWPLAARAQQPAVPVIGFLHSAPPGPFAPLVAEFRQVLSEMGFVEGQDVAIEYRWAAGQYDLLPALAGELVKRKVAVIVAIPAESAQAAKSVGGTIPIVFATGDDPVAMGLVAALNRPGGNTTGISTFNFRLDPKRLGLLLAAVPKAKTAAMLLNPNAKFVETVMSEMREAAARAKVDIVFVTASAERDFEAAFATFTRQRANVLVVGSDAFFISQRDRLVALAARYAVPAIYTSRESATAGGLMSYGPNLAALFRELGIITGRVLKGEKPSEMPIMQATRFEFVINLKTAKVLGIEIPEGLILAADEVIE